ncbi:MAG: hypothetical protein ACNA7O_19435 [Rhodobacterales bacterium]
MSVIPNTEMLNANFSKCYLKSLTALLATAATATAVATAAATIAAAATVAATVAATATAAATIAATAAVSDADAVSDAGAATHSGTAHATTGPSDPTLNHVTAHLVCARLWTRFSSDCHRASLT